MQTLLCKHHINPNTDYWNVEVFDGAVVKKHFFVNFQCSEFVYFWSASRELVKELIYQKKNGGHQASKRVIST